MITSCSCLPQEQSLGLEQRLRKYLWVYNWIPLARDPAFCEEVQMGEDNETVWADICRAVPRADASSESPYRTTELS